MFTRWRINSCFEKWQMENCLSCKSPADLKAQSPLLFRIVKSSYRHKCIQRHYVEFSTRKSERFHGSHYHDTDAAFELLTGLVPRTLISRHHHTFALQPTHINERHIHSCIQQDNFRLSADMRITWENGGGLVKDVCCHITYINILNPIRISVLSTI